MTISQKERLIAGTRLAIEIEKLETEAYRLGLLIGAQSLNRAKNAVGWEMADERDMAIAATRRGA